MASGALAEAAAAVRADAAARYPVLVDTTRWTVVDGRLDVSGVVLVSAQADAYRRALSPLVGEVPRPVVLTALSTPWTDQRWARLTGTVDLHRAPRGDDLQTQWTGPAHVRLFADDPAGGPRRLVQLVDGTVGWVDGASLTGVTLTADPWSDVVRAATGDAVPGGSLEAAAAAARARLGRPYRWGGNTTEAADCSGFVQAVALEGGVLLPKNTKDQLRRGARVGRDAVTPGDFVYVRGREKRLLHVGLALPSADGTTVIHSCLSRTRVLEEPLSEFLRRYSFVGVRRIVAWRDA